MAYLDDLKPRLAYDRRDYVRILRALLPRGIPWLIPLPPESDVKPNSISSSEAFGRVTISSSLVYITPNGIVSAEEVGIPTIIADYGLSMSGIPSAEVWGSPTVGNFWMQFSDFESGLGSGWDSEFTTDWYQTTEDGEGIAQRASDGYDRLYPPTGNLLTGDFLIEFGFWRSSDEGSGNKSVHVNLRNSGDTSRCDVSYSSPNVYGGNGGQFTLGSGPVEQRMRIERVSGVIWAYRWTGSAWEREDSWSTPGSSISNSEDLYIDVDGATGVNGFTYFAINGTLS